MNFVVKVETPLFNICSSENGNLVKCLIEHGIDITNMNFGMVKHYYLMYVTVEMKI